MEYRNLGRSGVKVSEICLGTMTFGNGADQGGATRMVHAALDAGVNFFDTANAYVWGKSEAMLGVALKGKRHQAVVASKVFNPMGPGPNDSGGSRLHIRQEIEASLKRLQTDYIDIHYVHHVDHETPIEETLRAFEDLVREGKILYTACSNFEAWRLIDALWIAQSRGWDRFIAYQPQYNLVVRDIDEEIVPACQAKGLGVVAWSPLASGYLAGKYTPGSLKVQGTRSAEGWGFQGRFFTPSHAEILQTLLDTAKEIGRTPAQTALRWVMDQPFMTSAIVGARNAEQLADTLKAGGWRLPAEALEKLNKISGRPNRYPRAFEDPMPERRKAAVKMPGTA
ncbi:aldo/keto reductase [Reyranella sp.]|jgi:aryl-alcohol dehydrogenase-like predicted oxidoreductase|uniref:aldo/keto reductase n=1 Tax=Reyranella sp. TaxID=1929291 RepID=UPI002F91C400